MTPPLAPPHPADPDLELDRFVAAFEQAVAGDPHADVAAFLPPADHPMFVDVLGELVRVDLEFAWGRGDRRRADDYTGRFPALAAHPSALRGVLREEARLRAAVGEEADPIPAPDVNTSAPLLDQMPRPGETVSGFVLDSELGRGAFGRVFLGRQADLADRPVVLKVSARFPGEWRTLARLQHAHVVPVYSVHRHGPFHVACMPYLGRTTLADLARRPNPDAAASTQPAGRHTDPASRSGEPGGIPTLSPTRPPVPSEESGRVEWVLTVGEQLADGLAHAHERGILHRDVKPANVLLTDDGRPMLLDFNLADDPAEGPAGVGGTLRYMAPEHLAALAGGPPPDARCDVYSLGLVLYELLAGRLPFADPQGSGPGAAALMRAVRSAPPPDVRTFRPDVSPAVASILATALTPDLARRYPSAAALREDLRRQLADRPLAFAPDRSLAERFGKWRRRHPRLTSWVTVTAAAVALLAIVVVGFLLRQRHFDTVAATNHLHRLGDVRDEVRARLTTRGGPRAEYAEVAAECESILAGLPAPTDPAWERHPLVRPLGEGDRRTAAGLVSELRWLKAGAGRLAGTATDDELLAAARALGGEEFRPDEVADPRRELPALRAAARTESGRWDYWYRLGLLERRAGDLAAARAHLTLAADLNTDSPWALFHLGVVALEAKDPKAAITAFDRCLELRADVPEAYLNRAIARIGVNDFRGAVADLDRIEVYADRLPRLLFVRARAKRLRGDGRGADADRAAGLKLEPTDALGWNARGEARLELAPPDVPGAVADFEQGIAADPDLSDSYQNLASALAGRLDRAEDAIKVLDRAVDRFPQFALARAGRAVLLARQGKREAARTDAEAALAADPQAIVCYQAGCVYLLTADGAGDRRRGMDLLRRALRTDPNWAAEMPTDPDLKSVWKSDDFRELVRAAGVMTSK